MVHEDSSSNTGTEAGNVHRWTIKPPPPRVFTDARLRVYYHAKRGGWFELMFTATTRYMARRIPECPAEVKLHYALDAALVEACCGLDLLPKDEDT